MRIVRMYSGTLLNSQDWKKVEVEVDENDLASILYEFSIDVGKDRAKVKTKYAFQLLTFEAEILLNTTMVQSFDVDVETVKTKLDDLRAKKNHVLEQLRTEISRASDED